LSGGEKQRIALARLFLLNPDILILDEATSKLDNYSEELIKSAINRLSDGKTVIAIAHRFTTIENSDILIGIKNHTIYETGTKTSLQAKEDSLFNKLYR
jgi:ATP-binding cassette subfamily B protein